MATPCINKSAKRRKVTDGMPFSAKKKKDIVSSLPDSQEILPYTPNAITKETKKSRLSLGANKNKQSKNSTSRLVPSSSVTSIVDNKPMERRWSVVGAPWARKKRVPATSNTPSFSTEKPPEPVCSEADDNDEPDPEMASNIFAGLSPGVSLPNLSASELDKENHLLEKHKTTHAQLLKGKALFNETIDDDDVEFMRIPKIEYEAIKERVSAIESRISQEFSLVAVNKNSVREPLDTIECVENQYQQTLEQTVPIEASCSTTDQLAKRLSRELKIRRSADQKIVRSPSARKIGSLRRRSKDNVRLSRNQSWHISSTGCIANADSKPKTQIIPDLSFYPKTNLKRGRPNTVQTGLKHPELSPINRSEDDTYLSNIAMKNITDEEKQEENWTCAQNFFNTSDCIQKVDSTPNSTGNENALKTPEVSLVTTRRTSIRSASLTKKTPVKQCFVTRIEIKTPMLPPGIPPRRTPSKTPMLPPKTPGRLESVVLKTHLTPLQELQSGRASIARLRSQNAGMVMAKAKLFDGMVNSANKNGATQPTDRHQGIKPGQSVRVERNKDGSTHMKPLMDFPQNIKLREVRKMRSVSANHNLRSPQRSTPRKRAITKSPHGGINRREKLRMAGKSPGIKIYHSPKVSGNKQSVANSHIAVCFSPNLYDLDNKTPHAKKTVMRNSPRRLISQSTPPHGRDIRSAVDGRRHTPLKATPLSKLVIAGSQYSTFTSSVRTPGRESPRLLANSGPRPSATLSLVSRP